MIAITMLTLNPSTAKIMAITSLYVTACLDAIDCFAVLTTLIEFANVSETTLDVNPIKALRK